MKKNKLALLVSLFILLALPSISLYYSFQGAKLRKIAMAELQPKGKLNDSIANLLHGEYTYRIVGMPCPDASLLDSLIEQFIPENLQFVFLGDSSNQQNFEPSLFAKWNKKGSITNVRFSEGSGSSSWKNCEFKLVDKSNQILNTYDLIDPSQRRKMVEHIALLVTRK